MTFLFLVDLNATKKKTKMLVIIIMIDNNDKTKFFFLFGQIFYVPVQYIPSDSK